MKKSYKTLRNLSNWTPATSNDTLRFKGYFLKRTLIAIAVTLFVGSALLFLSFQLKDYDVVCLLCTLILGLVIGYCLSIVAPWMDVSDGEFFIHPIDLIGVSCTRNSKGKTTYHARFESEGIPIEKSYPVSRQVYDVHSSGEHIKFWGIKTFKGFYFALSELSQNIMVWPFSRGTSGHIDSSISYKSSMLQYEYIRSDILSNLTCKVIVKGYVWGCFASLSGVILSCILNYWFAMISFCMSGFVLFLLTLMNRRSYRVLRTCEFVKHNSECTLTDVFITSVQRVEDGHFTCCVKTAQGGYLRSNILSTPSVYHKFQNDSCDLRGFLVKLGRHYIVTLRGGCASD